MERNTNACPPTPQKRAETALARPRLDATIFKELSLPGLPGAYLKGWLCRGANARPLIDTCDAGPRAFVAAPRASTQARSADELLRLLDDEADNMNDVNMSTALHRLGKQFAPYFDDPKRREPRAARRPKCSFFCAQREAGVLLNISATFWRISSPD